MSRPAIAQGAAGRVIVVSGGFAGAACARELKRLDPKLMVYLIEANPTFIACPFSNSVIAGLRELRAQQFNYEKVADAGVTLAFQAATGVDAAGKTVTLSGGTKLPYDRLVMAPGIDLRWDGLPGYTERTADIIHTVNRLKTDAQDLLVATTDPKRRRILEMMIEHYNSHIAELAQTINA